MDDPPQPSRDQKDRAPGALNLAAWTFRLLCLYPVGLVLLFYGFVLRARLALGEWPRPNFPDPKALGFDLHYVAILLGQLAFFAIPLGLLVLLLSVRGHEELLPRRPWWWLAFYVVSFFAVWWLLRADLGSFTTWFAD